MAGKPSRLSTPIDFEADGRQAGFLQLPHSVHRSAYGWLPGAVRLRQERRGADGVA